MLTKLRTIKAVYERSPDYTTARHLDRLTSSSDAVQWFNRLQDETQEIFLALHLDAKNRIVCLDVVSTGSLNASIVHPREVFKMVLLSNAAAVIFLHNHPSGDSEPSREDIQLTERLKLAGELLGIRVLDHIIIGENNHMSFADRGLLTTD
jgi:DNA repair protein RadC